MGFAFMPSGILQAVRPSRDPNVPHPGMVFFRGHWRSPESIERDRRRDRSYENTGERYIARRRRLLSAQRERITNQLKELRDGTE